MDTDALMRFHAYHQNSVAPRRIYWRIKSNVRNMDLAKNQVLEMNDVFQGLRQ